MYKKMVVAVGLALSVSAGSAMAQSGASSTVTCADLNWAAEVLAMNPDIAESCQAVYEKNGELYAKATIEVVRVRGNRMTFRPLHTDGTMGDSRSVQLDSAWRAEIAGRSYRASDLMRGQQLNVYLPQDRFALAVSATTTSTTRQRRAGAWRPRCRLPTTASPLFLIGAVGAGFLALGGMLTGLRRRS